MCRFLDERRSQVSITRCNSYEQKEVGRAVAESLRLIGGLEGVIRPGQRVLLKVNMLNDKAPDAAVTTHPAIVRAVIEEVKKAGGKPIVGDSPGGVSSKAERVYTATGIRKVAEECGAEVVVFESQPPVRLENPNARVLRTLYIARPVVEADVVINLPKLKTHALTLYTGAVKNLLGVIPGARKSEIHRIAPKPDKFAHALVDILEMVKPSLTLIDGVVGMEGNGPSAGIPRKVGLIIAGRDPVACDAVGSSIIGFKPLQICTTKAAVERGIGVGDMESIEVLGVPLSEAKVAGFLHPPTGLLLFFPEPLWKLVAVAFKVRPQVDKNICTGCGTCIRNCPQGAMTLEKGFPFIDYKKCIECFCCHELCPRMAIALRRLWFLEGIYRIMKGFYNPGGKRCSNIIDRQG